MSNLNFHDIFQKSLQSGISGAGATTIQVSSLMWLRTTMNYQYKFGGQMIPTIKNLYKEGGILRFYRGYVPALMVAPIARFGDCFSNQIALNYFSDTNLPLAVQTGSASVMAGFWRILTLPVDAWKTSMQVHGKEGGKILMSKVRKEGIKGLYQGAIASSTATMMGHFPFFLTYNYFDKYIPKVKYSEDALKALTRNAGIGFMATMVSDTVSNSMRVIKTYKQTHHEKISYREVVSDILRKDGFTGLMFRGLKTKIFTNGLQGVVFSIFYKYFGEKFN